MSVDVVCAGPVYLDLTFEGLEALPGPGDERFASDLHATPGGAAITAIGLTRLGLRAAVVAPLGRDLAGTMLRGQLEAEGIVCGGSTEGRTPVTVVLPVGDERAFATYEPPALVERSAVERLQPRAVVVGLDRLHLAPVSADVYISVGDRDADRFALGIPDGLPRARAILVNRSEALRLTGMRDAEGAALALADQVETAVVTVGADGVVAAHEDELTAVGAPAVEPTDTTGAGDLFMAAYVCADLAGLPLADRLRRAAVYAALSVQTATGAAGAPTRDELERALAVETARESS